METAYLAGGCFWGLQELLREVPGVQDTEVGYTGGDNQSPTYHNHPGHAESVKITYDPAQLSFEQLLDFFFRIHDPTTHNRQGNDVGSSYRSSIFYVNDGQRRRAGEVIKMVDASKLYPDPVVTSLEPLTTFWPAEDYHQYYLRKNPGGYTCHYLRTNDPIIK